MNDRQMYKLGYIIGGVLCMLSELLVMVLAIVMLIQNMRMLGLVPFVFCCIGLLISAFSFGIGIEEWAKELKTGCDI